jgi:hypothetical protein
MEAQWVWRYSSYTFATSAALNPQLKDPQYPLDRRLDRPQLVCTQRLEEKSFAGDRTWTTRSSSPWPDTALTELPRLFI